LIIPQYTLVSEL